MTYIPTQRQVKGPALISFHRNSLYESTTYIYIYIYQFNYLAPRGSLIINVILKNAPQKPQTMLYTIRREGQKTSPSNLGGDEIRKKKTEGRDVCIPKKIQVSQPLNPQEWEKKSLHMLRDITFFPILLFFSFFFLSSFFFLLFLLPPPLFVFIPRV